MGESVHFVLRQAPNDFHEKLRRRPAVVLGADILQFRSVIAVGEDANAFRNVGEFQLAAKGCSVVFRQEGLETFPLAFAEETLV